MIDDARVDEVDSALQAREISVLMHIVTERKREGAQDR